MVPTTQTRYPRLFKNSFKNIIMQGEVKTYKDLLEALQQLTPEQLEQTCAVLVGDDSYSKKITSLSPIGEDIYVNNDDSEEGGSLKDLEEAQGEDFKRENYYLSTPANRVFLFIDF